MTSEAWPPSGMWDRLPIGKDCARRRWLMLVIARVVVVHRRSVNQGEPVGAPNVSGG